MSEMLKCVLLLGLVSLGAVESGRWEENLTEEKEGGGGYWDGDTDLSGVARRNDFFMKAAKSVPRIGRRNDFFFAKNLKSVPRIGRRNDFFLKTAKSVPRIGRRSQVDGGSLSVWPWFRDNDLMPRINKKDQGLHDDIEDSTRELDLSKELEELRHQPTVLLHSA